MSGENQELSVKKLQDQKTLVLKPYHRPELEELGDLRDVTLGISVGINDSGGGGMPEVTKTYGS